MLPNLLQVHQRILEALANGCHTSKGRSLQLFALEERLAIFDQAHVVAGNGLDERLRGIELAQSDAEMTKLYLALLLGAQIFSTYSAS
jgi:hypothetical protein